LNKIEFTRNVAFMVFILFILSILTPIIQSESNSLIKNDVNDFENINFDIYSYDEYQYSVGFAKKTSYLSALQYNMLNPKSFKHLPIYKNIDDSFLPLSSGPMDSAWPMKCHDTHHTGRSPYETGDNPDGLEKWRFCDDHWMDCSPVIDNNGIIYISNTWGYLYAIYPNGILKWEYVLNGQVIGSSPAIAEDGTVYIGSWDARLYAINPNGTLKWRFPSGGIIASSPTIGGDGTIYVGNANGIFSAINPNGTEEWQYDTGGDIYSAPAIDDNGTIYIGSLDNYLYALYPNGTLRWRFKTGDKIYGSPSIAVDGTIYIGSSWDSYLYALYPNGTLKWKYGGAGTPNNPSIGSDGTIYSGYLDVLVALNPTGTLKWEFYIGDNRFLGKSATAISADGIIYVGTNIGDGAGGEIIAVNPDGSERWRKRIADYWVDSSPSIGEDGTVYIGSAYEMGKGYLHAFGKLDPNAPEAPSIDGETNGEAGVEYEYTFSTIDPNDDDVYYYIEWGDGEFEDWFGPYASGEEVVVSHSWNEQDTYTIRARAKDTDNLWGPWGELEVTMPVNQHIYSFPLIQRLLERFPNAFPILRQLLGL